MVKPTVVVIGAGVIGCSLAYELTRRGASVTIIDSAEAGTGTSGATFAWVNSNNKTPLAYAHLNLLGLKAHERVAAELPKGSAQWFHQTGNVQFARDSDELAAVEEKLQQVASYGYEAKLLTRAEVHELEPALDPARVVGGACYPKEGWIDTQTMCSGLLHLAQQAGATYAPYETVTEIRRNRVTTTTADGSTRHHRSDIVIMTAGNGNRRILSTEGIDFPTLDPVGGDSRNTTVGIICTTGPVKSGIRHVIRASGIAIRPARNGGITFADHPTGTQWDPTDPRIWTVPAVLLDRVKELYPSLSSSTESVRLGTRVLPEDGLTIADWINGEQVVYAIATHSGVTLAAHLAQVVAEEVLTGQRHESLRTFGLSRFAA